MSIPLAARKEIKEATPKCQAALERAGKAVGVTLQFTDQFADYYAKLPEGERNKLCTGMVEYYENLAKVFEEFAKDDMRKGALVDFLNKVGGKVRIGEVSEDLYWALGADAFEIVYKTGNFGSWMSYFNAQELENKLKVDWEGFQVSLPAKKSMAKAMTAIDGHLKTISAAVGKPITMGPGCIVKVYTFAKDESNAQGTTFGEKMTEYVETAAKTLTEFCKNEDNKEAIVDAWKSGHLDFFCGDDDWKYWKWENGSLCMQIKKGNFGSWASYYNGSELEKTL